MNEWMWMVVVAAAALVGAASAAAFVRRALQAGLDARIAEAARELEHRLAKDVERAQSALERSDAERLQLRAAAAAQAAEIDQMRAHLIGTYDEMDRLRALAAISADAKAHDTGHAYAATMPMELPKV